MTHQRVASLADLAGISFWNSPAEALPLLPVQSLELTAGKPVWLGLFWVLPIHGLELCTNSIFSWVLKDDYYATLVCVVVEGLFFKEISLCPGRGTGIKGVVGIPSLPSTRGDYWVSVSGTLHNWGTKFLKLKIAEKTAEGGRDCYEAMFRFWVDDAEVQGARVRGQGTLSQQWPRHLGWRLCVSTEHSALGAVTITCLAWMQTESKLCFLRVIVRFSAAVFPKVPYQTDLNVTKTTGFVVFSHPFQWKQVSDRFSSEQLHDVCTHAGAKT